MKEKNRSMLRWFSGAYVCILGVMGIHAYVFKSFSISLIVFSVLIVIDGVGIIFNKKLAILFASIAMGILVASSLSSFILPHPVDVVIPPGSLKAVKYWFFSTANIVEFIVLLIIINTKSK